MQHIPTAATPTRVQSRAWLGLKPARIGAPYRVASKWPLGPGYEVLGSLEGGADDWAEVLFPDVPAAEHPEYVDPVRHGYETAAEAQAAALRWLGAEAPLDG